MEQAEVTTPLDFVALGRVMRSEGMDVQGNLSGTRVGVGQSNLTYIVNDEQDGCWVARRPPLGELLVSAHDVERESAILTALAETGVPVPGVFCTVRDPGVSDAPVVVMECVDGLVVDSMPAAESLSMAARDALSRALPETLAAVHAVDLSAHGLDSLASHEPYAPRQLRRWARQWEQSKTREVPALDALTQLLQRTAPPPSGVTLVHGDFHVRNVICAPERGEIRAVLDWELATLGDPLADVGTMLAYWTQADDPHVGLFEGSSLPGFRDRAALVDSYCSAAGVDGSHVGYWHALGLWKIAIIAEGVHRRTLNEPSNAAQEGAGDPAGLERFIDHAWTVVRDAGLN